MTCARRSSGARGGRRRGGDEEREDACDGCGAATGHARTQDRTRPAAPPHRAILAGVRRSLPALLALATLAATPAAVTGSARPPAAGGASPTAASQGRRARRPRPDGQPAAPAFASSTRASRRATPTSPAPRSGSRSRSPAPAPLALQVDVVRETTDAAGAAPALAGGGAGRRAARRVGRGHRRRRGRARRELPRSPPRRRRPRAQRGGTFTLRSHIYPIRGPHADRGPIGAFGVGRNGGRTHEGFDVNARLRHAARRRPRRASSCAPATTRSSTATS